MREYNKITKRTITRYYVNGKGYNSESAALESIGRFIVRNLRWEYGYSRFPAAYQIGPEAREERKEAERQFMVRRYPCECKENCSRPNAKNYYGCLTARRRDYRRLGKMRVDGMIDHRGRPTATLALPERCA